MVARALGRSEALRVVPPTARAGSPTKAQPCVPLISTMHGQPFLIPLTDIFAWIMDIHNYEYTVMDIHNPLMEYGYTW